MFQVVVNPNSFLYCIYVSMLLINHLFSQLDESYSALTYAFTLSRSAFLGPVEIVPDQGVCIGKGTILLKMDCLLRECACRRVFATMMCAQESGCTSPVKKNNAEK